MNTASSASLPAHSATHHTQSASGGLASGSAAAFSADALLAVGDFDRNGQLDLAVVPPEISSVAILISNGHGQLEQRETYALPTRPVSIVAGDFDRDGNLDLAVTTSDAILLMKGHGDGTFSSPVPLLAPDTQIPITELPRASAGLVDRSLGQAVSKLAVAATRATPSAPGSPLTRKESEIVRLAVQGRSAKQIAQRLSRSQRTVENHLASAYAKLGVSTRAELVNRMVAPVFRLDDYAGDADRRNK